MYRYKYALIGALVVPIFMRINIHGTGYEADLSKFIIPCFVGGISGFLIGRMKDRWVNLNKNLETLVEERTKDLQNALDEVTTLRNILPICSYCKNIRNDDGYYEKIETYIHNHSGVDFSHTICPDCLKTHYPREYEVIKNKGR